MRVGLCGRYGLRWALLWLAWTAAAAILVIQSANAGEIRRCVETLPARAAVLDRAWSQHGASTVRIPFTPPAGRDLLFWVSERGVDVELEIQDTAGKVIAHAESPVDRIGARYVYVASAAPQVATIVIQAEERARFVGSVHLRVMASTLDGGSQPNGGDHCGGVLRDFAAAQESYAVGREITRAHSLDAAGNGSSAADAAQTAREAFESAARTYQTALQDLAGPEHVGDRADAQLALAALFYYGLQDWSAAESWAGQAAKTFAASGDSYQAARSQAIRAAAWMELPTRSASTNQLAGTPQPARLRLDQARELLNQLAQFHAGRGEHYDEALQINNIGLAYIYESRFEQAIPYLMQGQATFESVGDSSRAALALQNLALCQWGLGRLSAALVEFDRALAIMRPTPYPNLYLLTLNNSGLAHYAAGQFDTALRLQNQALDFAALTQSDRARARSYYGMGVTYYAIGDLSLAAHFLHGALEIETAELDARNRVATLRALAVVEREQGDLPTALTQFRSAAPGDGTVGAGEDSVATGAEPRGSGPKRAGLGDCQQPGGGAAGWGSTGAGVGPGGARAVATPPRVFGAVAGGFAAGPGGF
jgi:tetratricopeptide (TPR) repeat protein